MGKNSRRHHADKQRRAAERRRRQGSLVGPTSTMRSSAKYDSLGVRAGAHAADRAALRDAGLEGSQVRGPDGLPRAG